MGVGKEVEAVQRSGELVSGMGVSISRGIRPGFEAQYILLHSR